jgi:Mrp family chromosome partitioning ATPase
MEKKKPEKPALTTIAQLVETSDSEAAESNQSHLEPADKPAADNAQKAKADEPYGKNKNSNRVNLLDRLLAQNMLVPGSDLGRDIQEDYRRVKRPLVSNACGRGSATVENGNLILVTSSIPGEGKTFTSVNLALSISQEMDTTVLLVDCDVAKQGVSRMLGLENVAGLVDVLENDFTKMNLSRGDKVDLYLPPDGFLVFTNK